MQHTQPKNRLNSKRRSRRSSRHTGIQRSVVSMWFLGVSEALLLLVITAAPWCIGGIIPQFQMLGPAVLFIATCLTIAGLTLSRSITSQFATPLQTWLLITALLLTALQFTPLPRSLTQLISPNAVTAHHGASDVNNHLTATGNTTGVPLSLISFKSKQRAAWITQLLVTFFLSAILFRKRKQVVRAMIALTVNTTAMSAYGIFGSITKQDQIFGVLPLSDGGYLFGAFVNRNHAVGFIAIGLMSAVGLLVWITKGNKRLPDVNSPSNPINRHRQIDWAALTKLPGILLLAAIIAMIAGMITTTSRTAIAAMSVTACSASAMLFLRSKQRSIAIAAIILSTFGGVALWATNTLPAWADAALGDAITNDDRLEHWETAIVAINDFWLTGTGLGTYADVIPLYENQRSDSQFLHAENIYIETALESGAIGLLVFLSISFSFFTCAYRLVSKRDSTSTSIGVAALLTILWHTVHGCFDFAIYLPGVALPLMVILGAAVGRQLHISTKREKPLSITKRRRTVQFTALVSSLLLCSWWSLTTLQASGATALLARSNPVPTRRDGNVWRLYANSLKRSRILEPDNPQTLLSLALVELADFEENEWDSFLSEYVSNYSSDNRTQFYFPRVIHQLIQALAKQDAEKLSETRERLLQSGRLSQAWDLLSRSAEANPLQPQVHLMLAQLCGLFHPPDSDKPHLANAMRMVNASFSPAFVLEHVARAYADNGDTLQACNVFSRYLARSSGGMDEVDIIYQFVDFVSIYELDPITVCERASTSPEVIAEIALKQSVFTSRSQTAFKDWFSRWMTKLSDSDSDSALKAYLKALRTSHNSDVAELVTEWRSAIRQNGESPLMRSQFARILFEHGHIELAIEQIRKCLTARPTCSLFLELEQEFSGTR